MRRPAGLLRALVLVALLAAALPGAGVGARSTPAPTPDPARPLLVLVLGIDHDPWASFSMLTPDPALDPATAIATRVRADAIGVLRLDPATGSCRLLRVPRDLPVTIPGYGATKINSAIPLGGIDLQRAVVEETLGLTLDRYAAIDIPGMIQLVDAIGGVEVEVAEAFQAGPYWFEPGATWMDGAMAIAYIQFRADRDGDPGRIQRQEGVVRAILATLPAVGLPSLVADVLPVLLPNIATDLTAIDLLALGEAFAATCTAESLTVVTIEGVIATGPDEVTGRDASYVYVAEDTLRETVRAFLRP